MRGDGDGRYGFGSDPDVAVSQHKRFRQRSFSPDRRNNGNAGKELFAARTLAPAANIELFPNKTNTSSGPLSGGTHSHSSSMELFPDKIRKSHHRRSGAIDASPERFTTNGHERPRSLAERITTSSNLADRVSGGSLADRITPRGGSLADRITRDDDDAGLSIRGNSGISIKGRAQAPDDFSIKGASSGYNANGAKELFPVKVGGGGGGAGGNAGKELFGEKLKGRGLARRTAASYF